MEENSQENGVYSEQINKLERELQVIKKEKMENEEMYEKNIVELKSNLRDVRRVENSKMWREEELKKKLKAVEKLLENSQPDLARERNKIIKETDREKKDLITKN